MAFRIGLIADVQALSTFVDHALGYPKDGYRGADEAVVPNATLYYDVPLVNQDGVRAAYAVDDTNTAAVATWCSAHPGLTTDVDTLDYTWDRVPPHGA